MKSLLVKKDEEIKNFMQQLDAAAMSQEDPQTDESVAAEGNHHSDNVSELIPNSNGKLLSIGDIKQPQDTPNLPATTDNQEEKPTNDHVLPDAKVKHKVYIMLPIISSNQLDIGCTEPRDNLILPVQNDDDPPGSVLPSQFTMASHNTLHDQTNGQIAMNWKECTGTFLKKPATGWLHKDSDLVNGTYVQYRLNYLGCTVVMESMRSLKYELRTMATREAISRLAEYSEKIQPNKKRKSPKQVGRLLGDINARLANKVNLCIDTEQLQIVSPSSGRELMTHSLTTISFASGGEGVTQDFVGYVAKDPINDRACHVFHCPGGTAQLVLTSLGQAFELRYKMYLNTAPGRSPQSQLSSSTSDSLVAQNPPSPLPRSSPEPHRQDLFTSNNRYSSHNPPPYGSEQNDHLPPHIQTVTYENHGRRQLPAERPPLTDITHQIHVPLPPPPSIPPQSLARPRVYSFLPGFPESESNNYDFLKEEPQYVMEDIPLPLKAHPGAMGNQRTLDQLNRPMSYNPYDTMPEEYTLLNPNPVDAQDQDDKDHDYESMDKGEEGLDEPDDPPPPYPGIIPGSVWNISRPSPIFDDSIYSTPNSNAVKPAPVNSLAPLHLQSYFHGRISRADAEFLIQKDGDFLVRESSNKPGQYVLTGLANGRSQHLLIDKSGKIQIKSKDREFDSIPHLVKFFYERATSLTIGNCEVYLSNPVTVKQ